MTELIISVVDVSGGTHPDDKVRLWAPQHRPDGERVVSTSPVDVRLADGQAVVEVLPGPARVQVMSRGVVDSGPRSVTIPDAPSVSLRAVLEDGFDWEPEVVSRVARLAHEAEQSARRAEGVADQFGSLDGVLVVVESAKDAASAANTSAGEAAADRVQTGKDRTAVADDRVQTGQDRRVTGEDRAAAGTSAGEAAADRVQTGKDRVQTGLDRQAAGQSAMSAREDALLVQNAATDVAWNDDRLTVMGKTSPSLKGDKGDKGDPGEVTTAQFNAALAGKSDAGHEHTRDQITDLPPLATAATGSTVALRDAAGRLSVFPPSDDSHAVPRTYVDQKAAGKADLVGGVVPTSQIPAVALTKPFTAMSLSAMLALEAQEGDVAVITGGEWKGTYMLGSGPSHVASSWVRLSGPDAPVQSVNGQSGTVVLGPADVGAAPATHTHTTSQITGLPLIATGVVKLGLPQRDSEGHIAVPLEPSDQWKATSKSYVDRRKALFSGKGGPPSTIPGAVAGDWWLNESTMELHKITGV